MALEPVRFIHTSDWRLEEPLGGIPEVPSSLREAFIDAPFRSAERVIDAAIRENVDFVLMAGDILSVETASPYTLEFLLGQLQRLCDEKIAVYWAGGEQDDPDLWPDQLPLPDKVYTFPVGQTEELRFSRGKQEVAAIVGRSAAASGQLSAAEFAGSKQGIPRIGLVYGSMSRKNLEGKGIDYWALGSQPTRRVLKSSTSALYCGAPQGRQPDQRGSHGCELIELDGGQVNHRQLETAVFRWHRDRVAAPPDCNAAKLEHLLRQRLTQAPSVSGVQTLVSWSVMESENLTSEVTLPVTRRIIESLKPHGSESCQACGVSITLEPREIAESFWEEESILGDFLRAVRNLEQDPESWKELDEYLPDEDHMRRSLVAGLQSASESDRHRLWQEVASLGVQLLRGEPTLQSSSSERD